MYSFPISVIINHWKTQCPSSIKQLLFFIFLCVGCAFFQPELANLWLIDLIVFDLISVGSQLKIQSNKDVWNHSLVGLSLSSQSLIIGSHGRRHSISERENVPKYNYFTFLYLLYLLKESHIAKPRVKLEKHQPKVCIDGGGIQNIFSHLYIIGFQKKNQ